MVSRRTDTALTAYGGLLIACPRLAILPAPIVAGRTEATFAADSWLLSACPWLAVFPVPVVTGRAGTPLADDWRIGTIRPDSVVIMMANLVVMLIRLSGEIENAEDEGEQHFH